MGQEISQSSFDSNDFEEFHARIVAETALLQNWIDDGYLTTERPMAGCELEAWLVDEHGDPAPVNQAFLNSLNNPLVVPELSAFNIELNTHPCALKAGFLDRLYEGISMLWKSCEPAAEQHDAHMMMIGILPTIRQSDLCLDNISGMQRYRALNEQVFRMREEKPLVLDIRGREHLKTTHDDVMLEAAATSFQIHLKVDIKDASRAYNLSKILSAPMVALSANSPYLFGCDLWDETRIPLFEQSVAVGASDYSKRVSFGVRFARESIMECFEANRDRYPVLLPHLMDEPVEQLAHLRLHNGTIWRWNRPLIGFSDNGRPHVRIEHRVAPSGPTSRDMVANAAFYFGAVYELMAGEESLEQKVSFLQAKDNFYHCAFRGLDAKVRWADGEQGDVRSLCLQKLLPLAKRGLARMGLSPQEAERWLGIVRNRLETGQTGARWQRAWIESHGRDFYGLTLAYREHQQTDQPVHEWVC